MNVKKRFLLLTWPSLTTESAGWASAPSEPLTHVICATGAGSWELVWPPLVRRGTGGESWLNIDTVNTGGLRAHRLRSHSHCRSSSSSAGTTLFVSHPEQTEQKSESLSYSHATRRGRITLMGLVFIRTYLKKDTWSDPSLRPHVHRAPFSLHCFLSHWFASISCFPHIFFVLCL